MGNFTRILFLSENSPGPIVTSNWLQIVLTLAYFYANFVGNFLNGYLIHFEESSDDPLKRSLPNMLLSNILALCMTLQTILMPTSLYRLMIGQLNENFETVHLFLEKLIEFCISRMGNGVLITLALVTVR